MTRHRDIGEFRGWNFIMATVIFLAIGLGLYYRFDFRIDPKAADEVVKEQKEVSNLEQRIESLENANANLQIELRKTQDQVRDCRKSSGPEKRPHSLQKP
jgi:predicted ATP-grasp superfamily ATP-dependent carboligase